MGMVRDGGGDAGLLVVTGGGGEGDGGGGLGGWKRGLFAVGCCGCLLERECVLCPCSGCL